MYLVNFQKMLSVADSIITMMAYNGYIVAVDGWIMVSVILDLPSGQSLVDANNLCSE